MPEGEGISSGSARNSRKQGTDTNRGVSFGREAELADDGVRENLRAGWLSAGQLQPERNPSRTRRGSTICVSGKACTTLATLSSTFASSESSILPSKLPRTCTKLATCPTRTLRFASQSPLSARAAPATSCVSCKPETTNETACKHASGFVENQAL